MPILSQNRQLLIFRSKFGEIAHAESWVETEMSWVEVDGAGWSWMELGGAGWRWMELGARFSNTRKIKSLQNFNKIIKVHMCIDRNLILLSR